MPLISSAIAALRRIGGHAAATPTAAVPPARIMHYHIFKNAGTSIDRLLAASFGQSFASYECPLPFDQVAHDGLPGFLAQRPDIRAVSSHLPRRFLMAPGGVPIALLRHPIDRARSVYQFIRRDTAATDHPVAIGGFAEYVAFCLNTPGQGVSIRNYQVFHLSGAPLGADNPLLESTRDDLRQARDLLASWPAFGLVREFPASCQVFQQRYERWFPGLKLYDVRENASPDGAGCEADSIEAARQELGPALYGRLCAANELDLELYAAARLLFQALVHQAGPRRATVTAVSA